MRIALIEDEPDCSEDFQMLLNSRGHTVVVFDGADDVVKRMDEVIANDVIILDLMMQLGASIAPEEAQETGIALFKRIRERNALIPILVVTARSKDEVWNAFQNDAHVGYLGKPVKDVEELLEALKGIRKVK